MSGIPIRNARPSRAPSFITAEFVEIEVDADDLEEAGWQYVGKGDDKPKTETVLDVVQRWHDDTHEEPWRWCAEQPCDTLRGRGDEG